MSLELLQHASVGAPLTRAGISLVPVYVHTAVPGRIRPTIDGVEITESPNATVPTIVVTNPGPDPVLLVEGETVRGGQQDRTVNVSILVPGHATVECPVTCVEQGRWGGGRQFGRSSTYAPRRVRRAKQASIARNVAEHGSKRSDQSAVWNAVAFELDRSALVDPAGALRAADRVIERDERLARSVAGIVARGPLPGQHGVVVMHGRRVVGCDVFADPELLASHWEALVRGYFLDLPARVDGRPSLTAAVGFLRRFALTPARTTAGVGLGTEHHVSSHRLVGQALAWERGLVHASAFALAA